jgi:hypothetical protein
MSVTSLADSAPWVPSTKLSLVTKLDFFEIPRNEEYDQWIDDHSQLSTKSCTPDETSGDEVLESYEAQALGLTSSILHCPPGLTMPSPIGLKLPVQPGLQPATSRVTRSSPDQGGQDQIARKALRGKVLGVLHDGQGQLQNVQGKLARGALRDKGLEVLQGIAHAHNHAANLSHRQTNGRRKIGQGSKALAPKKQVDNNTK